MTSHTATLYLEILNGLTNLPFTFKVGGEAEHVVVVLLLVSQAVAADARQHALAPAGLSGDVNRILNASIVQPSSVAPVQFSLPRFMQLIEGRHSGVLVSACSLRIVKVQVVAAKTRKVGEDNPYGSDMRHDQLICLFNQNVQTLYFRTFFPEEFYCTF